MEIEVYEDQTGERIFPTTKQEKDENIKRFFNNNVDLHIEKRKDKLTVHCHVIARKGINRYQGYYIKYIDNYDRSYFQNFKLEAERVLNTLGLQMRSGNAENAIFDNIQKSDLEVSHKEDIGIILESIKSGDYINYQAGNIYEILALSRDILKKIDNINIYVSPEEIKLGNINILRKKSEEHINPTTETKEILDKYGQKLEDSKRRIELERGKNKIVEGFALVREGVNIFRNAGDDPTKLLEEEFKNIIDRNDRTKKQEYDLKNNKSNIEEDEGVNIPIIPLFIIIIIGLLASSYLWNTPISLKKMIEEIKGSDTIIELYPNQSPLLYNITGYVTSNQAVTIELSQDNEIKDKSVIGANGYYKFERLRNGTYYIRIQGVDITKVLKISGSDLTNINLTK